MFDPNGVSQFPELLVEVNSVNAVTGSLHLFEMDFGNAGWNRKVNMLGSSADLVELIFYANSAKTDLLFQTVSGGVTVVNSHLDQAGWPYFNTDASTISGKIYGTLEVTSAAGVGSDGIGVTLTMERYR